MRWTLCLDAIAYVKGRGLGKGRHSCFSLMGGWRIAPKCYIYIYIYIQKLNFSDSLFWIGFGEVLERFWREILDSKSCKNIVFYNGC